MLWISKVIKKISFFFPQKISVINLKISDYFLAFFWLFKFRNFHFFQNIFEINKLVEIYSPFFSIYTGLRNLQPKTTFIKNFKNP